MSLNRVNPKRDGNEQEIVDCLKANDVLASQLSGSGIPDLLCSDNGRVFLVEVKQLGCHMTQAQIDWWSVYVVPGGFPAYICRNAADVANAINKTRAHYAKLERTTQDAAS